MEAAKPGRMLHKEIRKYQGIRVPSLFLGFPDEPDQRNVVSLSSVRFLTFGLDVRAHYGMRIAATKAHRWRATVAGGRASLLRLWLPGSNAL